MKNVTMTAPASATPSQVTRASGADVSPMITAAAAAASHTGTTLQICHVIQ